MKAKWRVAVAVAAWWLPGVLLASAQAPSKVETTTYAYNPDGAITRVVEQVTEDGVVGTPTVTFFTWDNCAPDETDPSQCVLSPANGNLVGYGLLPGDESAWSAQYDVLDRLTQVTNGQGETALYQYHPDELLAASLNVDAPNSDGLQFYCDESRYPQVTNIYDRHQDTLSSRHQRIRYLPDGSQQLLVRHRKDTDGVYDPVGQTMNAYRYDPYGAGGEISAPMASMGSTRPLYSLGTNPFQYSAELRDPVSGADYLRARWYLPGHQTFLQRDPVRNLNRYGYANANPIMYYDPSGKRSAFFKSLDAFGLGALSSMTLGIYPLVATAEAEKKEFFSKKHDLRNAMMFLSVVASVVAVPASGALGARAALGLTSATRAIVGVGLAGGAFGAADDARQVIDAVQHHKSATDLVERIVASQLGSIVGGWALDATFATIGFRVRDPVHLRESAELLKSTIGAPETDDFFRLPRTEQRDLIRRSDSMPELTGEKGTLLTTNEAHSIPTDSTDEFAFVEDTGRVILLSKDIPKAEKMSDQFDAFLLSPSVKEFEKTLTESARQHHLGRVYRLTPPPP